MARTTELQLNMVDSRKETEYMKEQLDALVTAMQLLKNQLEVSDDENDVQLENLQRKWRLEDTGFCSLASTCHTMRDNWSLSMKEMENIEEDLKLAKLKEHKDRNRINALERALEITMLENKTMKKEVKRLKEERRVLAKNVKKIKNEREEIHERHLLAMTHLHQQNLIPAQISIPDAQSTDVNSMSSSSIVDAGVATVRLEVEKENITPKPQNVVIIQDQKLGIQLIRVCPETVEGSTHAGKTTFLVGGFNKEFDENRNARPDMGSRLYSINGISVDEANVTNFGDLKKLMQPTADGTITVSFLKQKLSDEEDFALENYQTSGIVPVSTPPRRKLTDDSSQSHFSTPRRSGNREGIKLSTTISPKTGFFSAFS